MYLKTTCTTYCVLVLRLYVYKFQLDCVAIDFSYVGVSVKGLTFVNVHSHNHSFTVCLNLRVTLQWLASYENSLIEHSRLVKSVLKPHCNIQQAIH